MDKYIIMDTERKMDTGQGRSEDERERAGDKSGQVYRLQQAHWTGGIRQSGVFFCPVETGIGSWHKIGVV